MLSGSPKGFSLVAATSRCEGTPNGGIPISLTGRPLPNGRGVQQWGTNAVASWKFDVDMCYLLLFVKFNAHHDHINRSFYLCCTEIWRCGVASWNTDAFSSAFVPIPVPPWSWAQSIIQLWFQLESKTADPTVLIEHASVKSFPHQPHLKTNMCKCLLGGVQWNHFPCPILEIWNISTC